MAGKVLQEKWGPSQALRPECDLHGKGIGRWLSRGWTAGAYKWELASGRVMVSKG